MKKSLIFSLIFVFVVFSFVSAQTEITYFYGLGCPHCANVAASGVLERVTDLPNVSLEKYEVSENQEIYSSFRERLNISIGWPLAIVNKDGNYSYFLGDSLIIENLESAVSGKALNISQKVSFLQKVNNFLEKNFNNNLKSDGSLTWLGLAFFILAALIDSINPCAFGVLIFLMISLLKIGSSKRALKAGLIYTFVVFVVYFLSGLGIFKALQSFTTMTKYIYLGIGLLVLIVGILEFIDFLRPHKDSIVKISGKVKPLIERFIHEGTIPAMIILGILVSLFELPCTGGIYLAVLNLMAINKTFGIPYLLLYNLIFVLPLIIITFLIYKGTNPTQLQKWTNQEKKWMKLAASIILVILGVYILSNAL